MIFKKEKMTSADTTPLADHDDPVSSEHQIAEIDDEGAVNDAIFESFDTEWYERTYAVDLRRSRAADESSFAFYLRCGARRGHDPNPEFSEVLYRAHNRDVFKHLLENTEDFGFRHFVQYGFNESDRVAYDRDEAIMARKLILAIDREFLTRTYGAAARRYPDIVDLYFDRAYKDQMSPSIDFSEAGYLDLNPDVEPSVQSGALICGYD